MSAIPPLTPRHAFAGHLEEARPARKVGDAEWHIAAESTQADPCLDVQIALFQPDIAANTAAVIRLAACLAVPVTIIEPCGFVWDERRVRRIGMDYLKHARIERVASFASLQKARGAGTARLVLLTTRASRPYYAVAYRPDDILLAGRESGGVPDMVHAAADLRVRVPMAPGRRSLNVVTALAMVLGEALRQTGGFVGDLAAPSGAL